MVQYVTGVNTEASFIHVRSWSSHFFPRKVAVGTFFFFFFKLARLDDQYQRNDFSVISVCLTLDFTAIMYCFMYIYMHVSRLNKVRLNRRIS